MEPYILKGPKEFTETVNILSARTSAQRNSNSSGQGMNNVSS